MFWIWDSFDFGFFNISITSVLLWYWAISKEFLPVLSLIVGSAPFSNKKETTLSLSQADANCKIVYVNKNKTHGIESPYYFLINWKILSFFKL